MFNFVGVSLEEMGGIFLGEEFSSQLDDIGHYRNFLTICAFNLFYIDS